jgi:hypothetical protein
MTDRPEESGPEHHLGQSGKVQPGLPTVNRWGKLQ